MNQLNTTTTDIGLEIILILQNEHSIGNLMSYFETKQLFDTWKAVSRDEFLYNYQIPMDEWTRITGMEKPSRYYRTEYSDGTLFANCYFDADGKEHDSIDYMYVALTSSLE